MTRRPFAPCLLRMTPREYRDLIESLQASTERSEAMAEAAEQAGRNLEAAEAMIKKGKKGA